MEEVFRIRLAEADAMRSERERVFRSLVKLLPQPEVSEVGSTAVPGAIGKQDIDIVVLVAKRDFESAKESLDSVFDRDVGQMSSEIYQGFRASLVWDVAIQLTVKGGPHDTFHAFIHALRTRPKLLKEYNQLKRDWDGKSMQLYRHAKALFIAKVLDVTDSKPPN